MLGLDVEALSIAGAFVLGALVGAVSAIRLTRAVLEAWSRARHRLDE